MFPRMRFHFQVPSYGWARWHARAFYCNVSFLCHYTLRCRQYGGRARLFQFYRGTIFNKLRPAHWVPHLAATTHIRIMSLYGQKILIHWLAQLLRPWTKNSAVIIIKGQNGFECLSWVYSGDIAYNRATRPWYTILSMLLVPKLYPEWRNCSMECYHFYAICNGTNRPTFSTANTVELVLLFLLASRGLIVLVIVGHIFRKENVPSWVRCMCSVHFESMQLDNKRWGVSRQETTSSIPNSLQDIFSIFLVLIVCDMAEIFCNTHSYTLV